MSVLDELNEQLRTESAGDGVSVCCQKKFKVAGTREGRQHRANPSYGSGLTISACTRQRAGFELWEVQQGNEPSDWKPMASVGPGVKEIRIHSEGEYRVLYVARFEEAIYVLHVFQKKAQRTPKPDIETASIRYQALLQQRRRP